MKMELEPQHVEKQVCIIGLGNPGKEYTYTRHNCGYLLVTRFATQLDTALKEEKKFLGLVAKKKTANTTVHLLLPTTYMNRSGIALKLYMDFYKIKIEDIIVVVDDIRVPFGEFQLKRSGGPDGHNGLKDIRNQLGTNNYVRLKMGISLPNAIELKDYVLSPFSDKEKESLNDVLDRGIGILSHLLKEDISHIDKDVNQ